jgi:hypothetical protein
MNSKQPLTHSSNEELLPDIPDVPNSLITNDLFLMAIFGNSCGHGRPLVCSISGDPNGAKWNARSWPCDTTNGSLNWYAQPSLFVQGSNGKYRAQQTLAGNVFCVMLDDIGTKVPVERINACPPSWLLETSPGNFQVGYIFSDPQAKAEANELKNALIMAGLCDAGAKGGAVRWMRMPVGVNGKEKHGHFQCKLVDWHPDRRYTIQDLTARLCLMPSSIRHDAEDCVYVPRADENEVIAALKSRGLYKQPLGDCKHDVTCPWLSEHTDQVDHGSAYFEPTDLYAIGGFKCQHGHGDKYRIGALLSFLGVTPTAAKHKPTIKAEAGNIGSIADAGERELAATGRYFQRGGLIVGISTDPESRETQIRSISMPSLMRALSICATWIRHDKRAREDTVIDPPEKHVKILFDSESYSHFPVLAGLARQPHLRGDGSVVTDAGYDSSTCLFGVFDSRQFVIKELPTRQDAIEAITQLHELLAEFSFGNAHDESAALAAMLTAAIRPSLRHAPMFHVRAPQIASGKSYLTGVIAAFAGPSIPSAAAFPSSEEECQKFLLATLLKSPSVVVFDNLTTDLMPYKSLCSALTEDFLTGRILGLSKTATVGTRVLFLSSGNNVDAVRDMARRCITINLDPKVETPATRQFKGDPMAALSHHRPRYVSLAITVIRAWIVSGCSPTACPSLASYGQWSDWVRQSLLWLGFPDPAARVFEQMATDPDRETLGRLLHAWKISFGSSPTTIREVTGSWLGLTSNQELNEVVLEISELRGVVNNTRLGKWIARHQGRIVDGLRFERAGGTTSVVRWSVVGDETCIPENTDLFI